MLTYTRRCWRWWGWIGDRGNGIGDTWSALRNENRSAIEDFAADGYPSERTTWVNGPPHTRRECVCDTICAIFSLWPASDSHLLVPLRTCVREFCVCHVATKCRRGITLEAERRSKFFYCMWMEIVNLIFVNDFIWINVRKVFVIASEYKCLWIAAKSVLSFILRVNIILLNNVWLSDKITVN